MEELKIALFGVGGFAANYLHVMKQPKREKLRLVGAVDPFVKECGLCPVYGSSEELYREHRPDIVILGTPIQFHAEQAIEAFEHGCHVVSEKPIAATMEEVRRMLEARDRAGKKLSVGFQLCYDPVVRAMKADVDAGVFGKPVSLKAMVLWPRDYTYYHRGSGWAGKKFDAQGRPIFDNVLSNATAHYLMNMLYVCGAPVSSLECATYRANPIETFDTAVMKGKSENGAELFIAVSHAVDRGEQQDPMFEYTYEKAVIRFGGAGTRGTSLTAEFTDGQVKDYGVVYQDYGENLWNMVDAIREDTPIFCTGEMASWHIDALEKLRKIQPESTPFPESWITETDGLRWVPGLAKELFRCWASRELPKWDGKAAGLDKGEGRC